VESIEKCEGGKKAIVIKKEKKASYNSMPQKSFGNILSVHRKKVRMLLSIINTK